MVLAVVDGDTIRATRPGRPGRRYDMNLRGVRAAAPKTCAGRRAAGELRRLLMPGGHGSSIRLAGARVRDGRVVATVRTRAGVDVAARLLARRLVARTSKARGLRQVAVKPCR